MSQVFKYTCLIHAIVALVFGAALLIAPGQLLTLFGWAPIDPILSRILGAALLALAWSSFRARQAEAWPRVALLVELEIVFTLLACVGLLRHLLVANYPFVVWLTLAVFAAFAAAWIVSAQKK